MLVWQAIKMIALTRAISCHFAINLTARLPAFTDLASRSNEMKDLQLLCIAAKSAGEFQETILMLLLLIHAIKFNDEFDDDICFISFLKLMLSNNNYY